MMPDPDLISHFSNYDFADVLPWPVVPEKGYLLDLSEQNEELKQVNVSDTEAYTEWMFGKIQAAGKQFAYGGYLENRKMYLKSGLFTGEEPRTLHLGVDLWAPAQTEIFLPLPGRLHSLADNKASGDYGPTLIFEHQLGELRFWSLFGHLSRESLAGKAAGQEFDRGVHIAWLGEIHENVDWPPHLHFQLMLDIGNYKGDFPGVCKPSEKEKWGQNCPDPNLILGLEPVKIPFP